MNININSLPDVVLRHIFSRLPLNLDQVLLHHVCHRWKSLQSSVTSKRKCLTLLIGKQTDPPARLLIKNSPLTIPNLDQIESDPSRVNPSKSTLEFSVLHPGLTTHLVSIFPHINSLCLVLDESDYETVDQVIHLLENWSKSLESLAFYRNFVGQIDSDSPFMNFNESSKQLLKLIRFIDEHCLTLECLTFDVRDQMYQFGGRPGDELDLPCLARLKEFKFYSDDNAEILFGSLKRYGASDRLKSISIGNLIFTNIDYVMAQFVQHPHIAAKFISLPIQNFYCLVQRQPSLFATFNSLTSLMFELDSELSLSELSVYLAPLQSLLFLYLTIYEELTQYDATPSYEFARLPSVKSLSLMLFDKSHTSLASRHWSTIFPSIQFIKVDTVSELCGLFEERIEAMQLNPQSFTSSIDPSIEQNKSEQCWKLLLAPLKQFDQLKKIVTRERIPGTVESTRKEWTIEELN